MTHAVSLDVSYNPIAVQTAVPGNAELQRGTVEGVRKLLGLRAGGQEALVGLALLTGGDYHLKGAVDVGPASAVTALRYLLAGHEVKCKVWHPRLVLVFLGMHSCTQAC